MYVAHEKKKYAVRTRKNRFNVKFYEWIGRLKRKRKHSGWIGQFVCVMHACRLADGGIFAVYFGRFWSFLAIRSFCFFGKLQSKWVRVNFNGVRSMPIWCVNVCCVQMKVRNSIQFDIKMFNLCEQVIWIKCHSTHIKSALLLLPLLLPFVPHFWCFFYFKCVYIRFEFFSSFIEWFFDANWLYSDFLTEIPKQRLSLK